MEQEEIEEDGTEDKEKIQRGKEDGNRKEKGELNKDRKGDADKDEEEDEGNIRGDKGGCEDSGEDRRKKKTKCVIKKEREKDGVID